MSKGRVILIGVDADVARTLRVYLEGYQFEVQVVAKGGEALTVCRQSLPNVVILDPQLPDTDGYGLCKRLRADERVGNNLIMALLFAGDRQAKLAALDAGADDVITHPVDIEELRLKIEAALRY
jgi:DNA-binding response OmpR family regulator